MRGVILAGGTGTRLHPITHVVSKQLLPVYDKPMIYYPISVLMLAGIRDILLVTTPGDRDQFVRLLGDGSQWGTNLSYTTQDSPDGIAQALLLGAEHIGGDSVALALGDNIFFGHGLSDHLSDAVAAVAADGGCTLFGYRVQDPDRYGVATLDETGHLIDIEEKPSQPKSSLAITGLYFYDPQAVDIARSLKPSARGELEITDVNLAYVAQRRARLIDLGRGTAWLDTGTHDSLLDAAHFVQVIQHRQGITIACLEEIAMRHGWISPEQALAGAAAMGKSTYGEYLRRTAMEFAAGTA